MAKMLGASDTKYDHICSVCDRKRSRFCKTVRRSRRRARAIEKRNWKGGDPDL